ncbi:hypothetical protein BGAL_0072g00250 [Botrytis galanthina]|uniref:Uncharacterized protein n=1 Tax=Botrytis galanthina TaxID=278940 RepID=A0A4S8RDZ7_9HELO|nr:hypothetical protein BGAL_0072g00250 [Botrytis galanthina]
MPFTHPTVGETPKSTPSLSQALTNAANAATNRANERQQIFGPIASLWDDYLNTEAVQTLPARLLKPLTALCADISATANKHFDSYINGSHPPRPSWTSQPSFEVSKSFGPQIPEIRTSKSRPQSLGNSAYAQKAATPPSQPTVSVAAKQPPKRPQYPNKVDTHLFVRLGLSYPARTAGSFAVLTALKRKLGEHSSLLKEVQATNTGFALCTNSITYHSTT